MRVLVAPQELKGTLDASAAAHALAAGIRAARPDAVLDLAPLADGGPGTVAALVTGRGGRVRTAEVRDPLGRRVRAEWAELDDGAAVVEMAAASGSWRVAPNERRALDASSTGTGELIRAALDSGARRILVGLGGSATTDGGAGALAALGVRFLDSTGAELPPGGGALLALERIDLGALDLRCRALELTAATDVRSPLLGPTGAARMFGPQKGADARQVEQLEECLSRLAEVSRGALGKDLSGAPGAGAAGGLGFGLAAFLGATLESGAAAVFAALDLERRVHLADVVVTGEGRLDAQSLQGKGPVELARLARAHGKRVDAIVGRAELAAEGIFDEVVAAPAPGPSRAAEALTSAAFAWASRLR